MVPYYIYSPPFDRSSGGIVVMHRLAWSLKVANQDVQLCVCNVGDLYSHPWEEKREGIAIYPEIVHGNPFGCKTVVRMLLNIPGVFGGPGGFPKDDLLYVYSKMFNSKIQLPENRILYVPCLDLNTFYDMGLERSVELFYRGKGKQPNHPKLTYTVSLGGKEDFRGPARQNALREMLNRCKILYVYDEVSCMTDIARLCGCPVVLIPNDRFTKEEYLQSEFWEFGGIGYDFDEQQYAEMTINAQHARDWYLMKEEEYYNKLWDFIEVTQNAGQ